MCERERGREGGKDGETCVREREERTERHVCERERDPRRVVE